MTKCPMCGSKRKPRRVGHIMTCQHCYYSGHAYEGFYPNSEVERLKKEIKRLRGKSMLDESLDILRESYDN